MTMTETQLDLSELQEDGDTLTLDDGRVLRLKIEVDQDTSLTRVATKKDTLTVTLATADRS